MVALLTSEHELKYKASLTLPEFRVRVAALPNLKKHVTGGGWDHYFSNSPDSFWRLRMDPTAPELTKKTKLSSSNQHRLEYDLKLKAGDPSSSPAYIAASLKEDGYTLNFSIYKPYEIWVFKNVNYVYYAVLNEDFRELDRFIEVEVNKEKVGELKDPTKVLLAAADKIGAGELTRVHQSLWELYGK